MSSQPVAIMSLERRRRKERWDTSRHLILSSIEVLLVVLAPVTAKYSSRVFVLVEDFTIHVSDDTVIKKITDLTGAFNKQN